MRTLRALSLLLCVCAADLAAQAPAVEPGSRVRIAVPASNIRTQNARWTVGTVEAVDSASLTLRTGEVSLVYPLQAISRIEVSQGEATARGSVANGLRRGALMGAAAGAAVGVTMVLRDNTSCDEVECSAPVDGFTNRSGMETFGLSVGIGAVLGVGIGMLIGSQSREQWAPVWLQGRPVAVSWTAGATHVGVSLRF